jgi:hypothetical protein
MTALIRKPWSSILAVIAFVAAGLTAAGVTSAPARAEVFIGVGLPGFWGYYPPPAYYYPYPLYYSYPYYYRYSYAYPAGVYFGHPFYRHSHPHWHRHWR